MVQNPPANERDTGSILDPEDPNATEQTKPMHHNY